MSILRDLDGRPEGWTCCDEKCTHDGPFAWETVDGWKLLREMIYEYGCSVLAETHAHA